MKKRISIITRPSKRIARFATVIALLAAMPLSPTVAAADKWVEARSPNFIVVSNAGESQARKTAIQFEQVRALFRQSLAAAQTHASPVMIIFAVKNEDSLRELLPEYWAQRGQSHPGGIFVNRLYQFSMAVNLAAHGDNPYEAIYHEYYHSLTMPYFPGLPLWVAEGLADFYGNSEISDKTAGLGRPNPGLITVLRSLPLIPLETLFQVNQRSPYYSEQSKVSIFYAESWALIHYLMLGDKGIHREALLNYLNAVGQGSSQPEAAAKSFGNLNNLEGSLEQYIRGEYFFYVSVPAPAKIPESEVTVRVLRDAEADGYRGSFLAMHGQYKEAQALVDEGERLDPKVARVQQAQAVVNYFQDRQTQALEALNAAVALDSSDALTRYLRAELSYRSAGQPLARESKVQIEEDLRQAIAISPEFAAAYGLLSVCLMTDEGGLAESFNLAKKAESLEPGNGRYQFVMAQVLARMRRYDDAETIALRVLANASEQQEQDEVNRFLEFVRKARSAPAPNNRQQLSNPVASAGPN
jgi:hypothetical protein